MTENAMNALKGGFVRREIWTICRPCAESAKDSYVLKIQLGKSEKVICAICGRRRYGNRYEVRRKGGAK